MFKFTHGMCLLLVTILISSSSYANDEIIVDWSGFRRSGIAEETKYNGLSRKIKPIRPSAVFTADVNKITWWAETSLKLYAMGLKAPEFDIRWYSPDNTLYFQDTTKRKAYAGYFTRSEIPVKAEIAGSRLGQWRIEVYYKGELVERRPFSIVAG